MRVQFSWRLWFAVILVLLLTGCAAAQPVKGRTTAAPLQASLPQRPAWIDVAPPDRGGEHFLVGLSELHASERDAREDAMRHAREQFAAYTGVEVALVDEVVRSLYGASSGILDATVGEISTSRQTSDALVSRIKARQWYWEKYPTASEEVAYRYWVLVSVPTDEYDRVQAWKRQKEQAQRELETARAAQLRQGLEAMAARRGKEEPLQPETIAVAPVQVQPGVTAMARSAGKELELAAAVQALNGRLVADLHRARVFQVVQKAEGARYQLLAEVDGFEDSSARIEYQRIGRTSLTRRVFLSSVLRIVETSSGALVAEAPAGHLFRERTVDLGRPGAVPPGNEILVDLASEMAQKLVQEAVGALRPARVLAVSGTQLLIDRGSEDGFRPGSVVELYAAETIRDGVSGARFRNELAVGKAKIVRAEAAQSFAVCDGMDPALAEGLIARVVEADSGPLPVPAATGSGEDRWMTPGSSDKPVQW